MSGARWDLPALSRSVRWPTIAAVVVSVIAATLGATAAVGVPRAQASITQRPQPKTGPGGGQTPFGSVKVTAGGSGNDAWYIFEPVEPTPPSAPLVIVNHGYFEYSGYSTMQALIRHTTLKGNVVIYTRWQTSIASPCPGPISIDPCVTSSANGIRGALAYLHAHHKMVQPRLGETSYFGFSFGGIITANELNRYQALGLPKPRAVLLDDPEDGGVAGPGEPALDDSLSGIPRTTRFVCHSGAGGALVLNQAGVANSSCNVVFARLGQIPTGNKSLVLTSSDSHGSPPLRAIHGVCAANGIAGTGTFGAPDTYDWGFCWKTFDALRSCAYYAKGCAYALGDNLEHRYIGTWSDGVPVIGLKIQESAPIRPAPTPPRQTAPSPLPNNPPVARLGKIRAVYAASKPPTVISGSASGDNGAQFVQVAIVRRSGVGCTQMIATGAFVRLAGCGRPRSFLWATGDSRWSLTLPVRLRKGSYRAYTRAIDSFGQTQPTYTRASIKAFTIN
ncbi:MAG: hypothetical protein M3076_14580 [Actinomycetota bacterium]|nr:hypothetical protein [Actinomycetota bacterium]